MSESIRILHVDDDPEFADLTAEFIQRDNDRFEIDQAHDAPEALEYIAEHPVDCVVSDYKLPGMNGIELLERVRTDRPELPFILFTGKGSEQVASRAISAGATDYFQKENVKDQYDLLVNRITNAVSASASKRRIESKQREYRTLIDEAPVTMVIISDDREIEYVNEAGVETLGAAHADDVVGKQISELLPAETLEQTQELLERVLTDQEPSESCEFRFFDLAGTDRYGRGTIVPVTFDGASAAQAVVADITEQKRQETQLKQQREQIANLHEVGVELANCETASQVYQLTVDTAEELLALDLCVIDSVQDGYLTVEATSTDLTEYEDAPVEEGGIAGKAYRTGKSFLIHDTAEHPEADPVDEFGSAITVPVGDYGVFQAAAYEPGEFDDVDLELVEILVGHAREALTRLEHEQTLTEQRDRLRQENERLDEFASIISHDLRNPLNVAQLRLDLAQDDCESDHLEVVERSVNRMETLTDELLALARQGEDVTEFEPVDLGDVASGCWRTVETGEATLEVETDAVIQGDTSRVQQLFENLMRNVIDHAGRDVTVTVGDLENADGFYLADDGPGIPDDVRSRIFESGFTTSKDGTGFGLAIVARIAEAHDWEIAATESELGGARFEITDVEFAE